MRILAVSDTHGDMKTLRRVVMSQPGADTVIHCGDGAEQADMLKLEFPDKTVISVRGNCDFCCEQNSTELVTLCGKRILVTHGHVFSVKYGLRDIINAANEQHADIVLFGHTHEAYQDYRDGLYILNPGSCRGYGGTYGTVDIIPAGILTSIHKVISV